MSKAKKNNRENLEKKEIFEEAEFETQDFIDNDWEIEQEELCEETNCENIKQAEKEFEEKEDEACNDKLMKLQADFENFKARTKREREDMIFFLKQDILLKILPRIDDLERIIENTPDNEKNSSIYEWIIAMEKKIKTDLEKMWVKSFESIWKEVDPDLHDVMTTIPWWEEWIIANEFEKWYKLNDRVLRHAKVVAHAW